MNAIPLVHKPPPPLFVFSDSFRKQILPLQCPFCIHILLRQESTIPVTRSGPYAFKRMRLHHLFSNALLPVEGYILLWRTLCP